MATLTVEQGNWAGLNPSYSSASAGGDDFPNDGKTIILANNTDASDHDIQIDAPLQAFGQDVDPNPVTVPAGASGFFVGAFLREDFGETITLTYPAGVTGLELAPVRVGAVQAK